jgi:hypothetical protein
MIRILLAFIFYLIFTTSMDAIDFEQGRFPIEFATTWENTNDQMYSEFTRQNLPLMKRRNGFLVLNGHNEILKNDFIIAINDKRFKNDSELDIALNSINSLEPNIIKMMRVFGNSWKSIEIHYNTVSIFVENNNLVDKIEDKIEHTNIFSEKLIFNTDNRLLFSAPIFDKIDQ